MGVYTSPGKKKSGNSSSAAYKKAEEVGTKLENVLENTDAQFKLLYYFTGTILFVMGLTLLTLFFDAVKFHIDYSSNNKDLLEFERRLDRIELQNKLIFKKYPDIFDGLSLQDLQ